MATKDKNRTGNGGPERKWIQNNKHHWEIICGLRKANKDELHQAIDIIKNSGLPKLNWVIAIMDALKIISLKDYKPKAEKEKT